MIGLKINPLQTCSAFVTNNRLLIVMHSATEAFPNAENSVEAQRHMRLSGGLRACASGLT